MVEGRPFLILGGELHNSDSSSLEYMKQIWPRISELRGCLKSPAANIWLSLEFRQTQKDAEQRLFN